MNGITTTNKQYYSFEIRIKGKPIIGKSVKRIDYKVYIPDTNESNALIRAIKLCPNHDIWFLEIESKKEIENDKKENK